MYNSKKKIFITVICFSLVIIILFFACIYLVNNIKKIASSLTDAKNSIETLAIQTREIKNFKTNYQEYKASLQEIDKLFVSQQDPVSFIEFLEKTALSTGVTSKASLQSTPKDSKFMLLQISASANSVQSIYNFINKLENGHYLLELQNINLQNSISDNETKQDKKTQTNFLLKVFTK
jgi:hypothetical protein